MQLKDPDRAPRQISTGTQASILANRISWYFDLQGPSVHIDTACSSSLIALDMACQTMRSGDATRVSISTFFFIVFINAANNEELGTCLGMQHAP